MLMFPSLYLVLTALGWSTDAAKKSTQVAAAVVGALVVIRRNRGMSPSGEAPGHGAPRILLRAVLLTVAVYLAVAVVTGVVSGFEPIEATGDEEQLFDDRMEMVVGLPVTMLVVHVMGIWSVRFLPVQRALVWLALVVVASRVVALSMYPLGAAFGRAHGLPVPAFHEALVAQALLGVLIFCFLALGNLGVRTRTHAAGLGAPRP
ncbi:hypothetical protein ABT023_11640 [Micromonospora sp. NPDC002296]|uniref:hypothetical protein n=1 Tax=Micromonospora sp. NPDC002296 TaxID=3154271 RepID=UPI00331DA67B